MPPDQAVRERYRLLYEQVNEYDDLYRQGRSPVSDETYDALVEEIAALESEYPELLSDARQQLPPAWSLERTFEEADVREFDARVRASLRQEAAIEYTVEPKIDGCSLHLVYEGGHLTSVHTRGLETEPRDIMAQLLPSLAVGTRLNASVPFPRLLELRAEATVSLAAFRKLNRQHYNQDRKTWQTPRGYVTHALFTPAGPLPSGVKFPLEIHCHEVLVADMLLPETYDELMALLASWGPTPVPDRTVCVGIEQVLARFNELLAGRDSYPYEMDGIVIKVNRRSWQQQLGERAEHSAGRQKQLPRWALAFKFPYRHELGMVARLVPARAPTPAVPLDVDVQLGIDGETVRATLDVASSLHWQEIYAGDIVRVRCRGDRAAEVIGLEAPYGPRQDLNGIVFVLAGELSSLKRELAREVALARGAQVNEEIDSEVTYVVGGDAISQQRLEKAKEAKVPIIGEGRFLAMLGVEMTREEMSGVQIELFQD